ncbi:MAG: ribosomal-processing cysteine protease Prp [Candidatus Wallbacteria bacterium]
MIKALFLYNKYGFLTSYEISGHDPSAESGKNIICAAVSALALTFTQSLIEILKLPLSGKIEKGFISLSLPSESEKDLKEVELLLKSLILGLRSINKQYGNVIQIIEKN